MVCIKCHVPKRVSYLEQFASHKHCGQIMLRVWNSTHLPKKKASKIEWDKFFAILLDHPYYKSVHQGNPK
jgi:hypothetical protein